MGESVVTTGAAGGGGDGSEGDEQGQPVLLVLGSGLNGEIGGGTRTGTFMDDLFSLCFFSSSFLSFLLPDTSARPPP